MKRISKRLIGAVTLLLCLFGIAGCVYATIRAWSFRQESLAKIDTIETRATLALQRAATVNANLRRALELARQDVESMGREAAKPAPDPLQSRIVTGMLRSMVREQVGPNVSDLGERLALFSDATVAVTSLLNSAKEFPGSTAAAAHADELDRAAAQATQLGAALQKLQTTLGEQEVSGQDVSAAAGETQRILQRCEVISSDWNRDLDAALADVSPFKAEILERLKLACWLITGLSVWGVICQVSLMLHALKWLRD